MRYAAWLQVLDITVEEMEQMQAFRVLLTKANAELVKPLTVPLPPGSTVADLLQKVRFGCPQ